MSSVSTKGFLKLLFCLYLCITNSQKPPPRLTSCRLTYKAKTHTDIYNTQCRRVTFPCSSPGEFVNYTDTRNCENYWHCDGKSLSLCPCPPATQYNYETGRCEDPFYITCRCPVLPSTAPLTTTEKTTEITFTQVSSIIDTTKVLDIKNTDKSIQENSPKSNNYDAMIGGIVGGIIAAIIIVLAGILLWRKKNKKADVKAVANAHQTINQLQTPTHTYDEIDEKRMYQIPHLRETDTILVNKSATWKSSATDMTVRGLPNLPNSINFDCNRTMEESLSALDHRGSFVGKSFYV